MAVFLVYVMIMTNWNVLVNYFQIGTIFFFSPRSLGKIQSHFDEQAYLKGVGSTTN